MQQINTKEEIPRQQNPQKTKQKWTHNHSHHSHTKCKTNKIQSQTDRLTETTNQGG